MRIFAENRPVMKMLFIGAMFLFLAAAGGNLHAQSPKLIVGERAPELKILEWLTAPPAAGGTTRLVEFFHSSSRPSVDRLAVLDALAKKYAGRVTVVVIAREPKDKIAPFFGAQPHAFSIALDDGGKTFTAYNVQFVPFSVVIDGRGKLRWFGNPSDLTDAIIENNL